jgi:hypothetical protein
MANNPSNLVIGFAYKTPRYQGTDESRNYLIYLLNGDPSNNTIVALRIDVNNRIYVYRDATWICSTAPLKPETWYYIEWKIVPHWTNGSTEIRINGVTAASSSGVRNRDWEPPVELVRFYAQSAGACFDDIYILDDTGSVNNDFLGPCMVESLLPESDTADADFTLSAGTDHYAMVDEIPCDLNTTYAESGIASEKDIWDYADLSEIDGSILGVQVWTHAVAPSGSFTMLTVADDGTTQDTDAGVTIDTTSYTGNLRIMDQTPSAGSWSTTIVNGSSFGVEVG